MAVTMEQVRAALDPEEPNYEEAAQLGPEALPHLEALVQSGDTMLASKATYLASLIKGTKAAEIVKKASQSDDPVVRVAAAAATTNLSATAATAVLTNLVGDDDPGVRKVAQQRAQERPSDKLSAALESLDTGLESLDQPEEPPYKPLNMGLMPGEVAQPSAAETMANNPATAMPGEPGKMPGER